MERELKKLYNGLAELRDYDVQNAIARGEKFRVRYDGDIMTLTPEDLKNNVVKISNIFASKIGKGDYRLVAYKWNPDKIDY